MKYKLLLVAVIVLIVLGTLMIVRKNNSKVSEIKVDNNVANTYIGDYLKFTYLPKYTLEKIPTTDGRVLINVKLKSVDEQMLIYSAWEKQELDQLADVQMRRGKSWQYSEEVARMGEIRGLLFRTADKKERTAFFLKNGQLLVVTLTAKTNDPVVEKEFQEFLEKIVWK